MVLSKGLLISLGFTLIVGVLLFLFIKQKTGYIESRINTLFNLVHEEAEKNQVRQVENKRNNMIVSEVAHSTLQSGGMNNAVNNAVSNATNNTGNNLITVSDDSEDDNSGSDSDSGFESNNESIEGSDVESEEESDNPESEEETQEDREVVLEASVSNIDREFASQSHGNVEIKYVKLDQEEGLEGHNIHMMMMNTIDPTVVNLMPNDITESSRVTLVSDEDEDEEDLDDESDLGSDIDELSLSDHEKVTINEDVQTVDVTVPVEPEAQPEAQPVEVDVTVPAEPEAQSEAPQPSESKVIKPTEEFINYSKLSVKVLREIVSSKGLHSEPAKLKKKELLKVLE